VRGVLGGVDAARLGDFGAHARLGGDEHAVGRSDRLARARQQEVRSRCQDACLALELRHRHRRPPRRLVVLGQRHAGSRRKIVGAGLLAIGFCFWPAAKRRGRRAHTSSIRSWMAASEGGHDIGERRPARNKDIIFDVMAGSTGHPGARAHTGGLPTLWHAAPPMDRRPAGG
jgi:hypothetical protein